MMIILTQVAALKINPLADTSYNMSGSHTVQGYVAMGNTDSTTDILPNSSGSNQHVSTGTTFIQLITDAFSTIKSWWNGLTEKFDYPAKVLKAFPTFLGGLHLFPDEFIIPICGLWYALNLLIIGGYLVGRD